MLIHGIVLCAGKGTRMKSDQPKVVQTILGYEMINYVLKSLREAGIEDNTLVVGYKKNEVIEKIKFNDCHFVTQEEQLGTGHAIKQCKESFKDKKGITIIAYGDTPLITPDTFKKLIEKHQNEKNKITILTAEVDNPYGYGRIIRNDLGTVERIVEENDATYQEKEIKEVNSGIYCFDTELLFSLINEIKISPKKQEYYLTDLIEIFKKEGYRISAFKCKDETEIKGVNDLVALDEATEILQARINKKLQLNGIKIINSKTTFIGPEVKIGKGSVIYPNNIITGNTVIGENNILKQGNTIDNIIIENNNLIGPNAHLHTNTHIGSNTKLGNFVECKNVIFKDGSKAAHLTYLGDCEVGQNTNIGCGVITANYDGKNKHKTIIGNDCFIGSNATLIAPIKIEDNVLVAAGSTITLEEIEQDKLVIARAREVIKERKK